MSMRTSVDIDLIVHSFIQNLQSRSSLGRFVTVDINFNSPVTITIDAENRDEAKKVETAELLDWVNRYKEHVVKHDLPFKDTYSVKYDL